jgi:hypothetical protein
MHILFPTVVTSIELLLLRRALVDWTVHTGVDHHLTLSDGGIMVRLPELQHYSQWILQWTDRDYMTEISIAYMGSLLKFTLVDEKNCCAKILDL